MTSWINVLPALWLTFSHLSLAFGLTKKHTSCSVQHAAWFPSSYLRIPLPTNMLEVVKMACACIARKASATSRAQMNTNRQ